MPRRDQERGRAAAGSPALVGARTALPDHRYRQRELAELARALMPERNAAPGSFERFFDRMGVRERYLALPREAYGELSGLEARSRAWLQVATDLGERLLRELFEEVDLSPAEIGEFMTTTVTGLAVPSLDARLMNRIPLSPHLKRVPSFGLGCVGGAAGVARVADYLRAFPQETALLLSVELCSLTLQRGDVSPANVISAGLFGDGAAAVLLAGAEHPHGRKRPQVVDSRSVFFADTERIMGWDMIDTGFKVVLSPEVPRLVRQEVPGAVDSFLAAHGLTREEIATWIMHPGGPKVLEAIEQGLELPSDALDPTREGLAEFGNLSSASVLFLLDDFLRRRRPAPGAYGLMMAMGPAFCAELVLIRW